jgi:hypothetical protein
MPNTTAATIDFDASWVTSPKVLEFGLKAAIAAGNDKARASLEARAVELDCADLIPAAPATPPRKPAPAPTKLLEQAPEAIMQADNHVTLDRVLRTLALDQGISYIDALDSFQRRTKAARERMRLTPLTLGEVIGETGVKDLERFDRDCQMVTERDEAVTRQLEADLVPVKAQKVNEQGQVLLGEDFDAAAYLHDDERRERAWRAARTLSADYGDRRRFDETDVMLLEGGVSLLATLERPAQIAKAHEGAGELARTLDNIIESDRTTTARTKELDQAVAALELQRDVAGDTTKTLDDGVPAAFHALDGDAMVRAIRLWESRPGTTLEQASTEIAQLDRPAVSVTGPAIPLAGTPYPDIGGMGDGHRELDGRIRAEQANGLSFADAFAKVTGVAIAPNVAAN